MKSPKLWCLSTLVKAADAIVYTAARGGDLPVQQTIHGSATISDGVRDLNCLYEAELHDRFVCQSRIHD